MMTCASYIKQCDILHHVDEVTALLRCSFSTVAQELGLTAENCPLNPAFTTAESLKGYLAREHCYSFGLYIDDVLCGFIALIPASNGDYEITRLAVRPCHRHKGCGRRLLDVAVNKARDLGVKKIVIGIIDGKVLSEYYKTYGFEKTARKKYAHLPFTVCEMEMCI